MHKTRGELLSQINASELLDWELLEDIDPWGQARDDYRFGMLAATITNALGVRKPGGLLFVTSDFIPNFVAPPSVIVPTEPRTQSPAEIEFELQRWITGSNIMFEELRIGVAH